MRERISVSSQPVGIYPENPHYYMFDDKPVLLITSAEHYGAVINMDFNYKAYFDMLHKYELNYTRIYPGAYVEIEGMFIEENMLAPKPGRLIVPWARSSEPGCSDGGSKFDLYKWDEDYFKRLRNFIEEAAERDIVVEICFFNCQYPEGWPHCPLNSANNIQGIGDCHYNDVQTTKYKDLYMVEKDYVRKIVEEVNEYDNIILEFCDEPTLYGTPDDQAVEWISGLIDTAVETESRLPKKHLIAQQLEAGVDFSADPRVPVIVTQYIYQNTARQIGGVEALDSEYGHDKPIELNETGFYPIWYEGDRIAAARVEAWEFMIGGGAGFNNLNGFYTVKNPGGDTPENHRILATLKNLKHFMYNLEFEKMYQDKSFIKGGVPEGAHIRSISEPGRQYALYIHHSTLKKDNTLYIVNTGNHSAELQLEIPAGTYKIDWVCPESGNVTYNSTLEHKGGILCLSSPGYTADIALRIKALPK